MPLDTRRWRHKPAFDHVYTGNTCSLGFETVPAGLVATSPAGDLAAREEDGGPLSGSRADTRPSDLPAAVRRTRGPDQRRATVLCRLRRERRADQDDADLHGAVSAWMSSHADLDAHILGNRSAKSTELFDASTLVGVGRLEVVTVLLQRVPDRPRGQFVSCASANSSGWREAGKAPRAVPAAGD